MTQPVTIPARPESIALIDMGYLFKKYWHAPNDGSRLAAAKGVLRDLERLSRGVAHIILCRDAPPYTHRLEVFPAYKANRPEIEPEERAQKKWLFVELQRLGYNIAWSQGYEADDVIATLAREYGQWCSDVRIVGSDKDMAQCITERVIQYIPPLGDRDWEIRDVAGVEKKFGVKPQLMVLWQALKGDRSDNIPGVPKVGDKIAAELCNKYGSPTKIAEWAGAEASRGRSTVIVKSLIDNWNDLVLSLKLVTLDTAVPVDTESLLIKRAAEPEAPARNSMDVEFDGYVGNDTPQSPQQDGVTEAAFEEAVRLYQDKLPTLQQAAKDAGLLERETERERERNEEHDTTSNEPGDKAAERVVPTKSEVVPAPVKTRQAALATAPTFTQTKYGIVTADLQPLDLQSAYTLSEWFHKGGLYIKKFKNEAQVFTIMAKAKELGLKMTIALDNFHVIDGKPSPSADLIRALAERDPNFEYLMPTEMSPTRCVWRGKHRQHPTFVEYAYTLEEARAAGLLRSKEYGEGSNWNKRPQDMLCKTAGSKLARLLWPAATMGLYCVEEMGYSTDELDAREAA